MKWYHWLIIIIILAAAWYGYTLYKKSQEYKQSVMDGKTPEQIVQKLIDDGNNFSNLKQKAEYYNIQVLRDTDTHTMEYNPRRVIVKEVQVECFSAPCPSKIQIVSIG